MFRNKNKQGVKLGLHMLPSLSAGLIVEVVL